MPTLTAEEVRRLRRSAQLLIGPGPPSAAAVVDHLTCVQSQERDHAFWSVGFRATGLGLDDVRAAYDRGDILRTHVLRPTWHLLTADDLGWVLSATKDRVHQLNAGTYRRCGLDPSTLDTCAVVIGEELAEGRFRTRPELGEALTVRGVPLAGMALAYAVLWCELEGLICSGPQRGAQDTYALVSERVSERAPALGTPRRPECPLVELLRRFLVGRGPSTPADFARWSSHTLTSARTAMADLVDELGDQVETATCDGVALHWLAPSGPAAAPDPETEPGRAHLLPLYDELTLSHLDLGVPRAAGHPHVAGTDRFVGIVLAGGRDVGLWRRTVAGRRVRLELDFATGATDVERDQARREAERLAVFLGKSPIW